MTDTRTMTLVEFLTARLDEDARRLDAPDFMEEDSAHGPGWGNRGECPVCGQYQFSGTERVTEDAWWEHAETYHQHARAMREVEAKRRVVELHYSWGLEAKRAPEPPFGPIFQARMSAADSILRALASVYSDHPDYDLAWT